MISRMLHSARAVPELDDIESPPGRYTAPQAYEYCEKIARGHWNSYALARRFVPEALRPHVWALYAFARSADDFADEPRYDGRRRELLSRWEHELERAFHGEAEHPIFVALADTVERRNLPIGPLRDLLTGYAMDLSIARYNTSAELERYAAHAAAPIGRLFLYLFDKPDPALQRYTDEICTGLQIAKICQDVALDRKRDRVYLPVEDLRHFGVSDEMLSAERASPQLVDLLRFEVARARCLLERGRPVLEQLRRDPTGGALAFQVALVFHAGAIILERIEGVGFDVLAKRPRLSAEDKQEIVTRASGVRLPEGDAAR